MESGCWFLFVQFVIRDNNHCGLILLKLYFYISFKRYVQLRTGSNRQKCSGNWERHFRPWTFIQVSVHPLILHIGKSFLQFFLHMSMSEMVRSPAEIPLGSESLLWYLRARQLKSCKHYVIQYSGSSGRGLHVSFKWNFNPCFSSELKTCQHFLLKMSCCKQLLTLINDVQPIGGASPSVLVFTIFAARLWKSRRWLPSLL